MSDTKMEETGGPNADIFNMSNISSENTNAFKKLLASYESLKSVDDTLINIELLRVIYNKVSRDEIPLFRRKNGAGLILGYICADKDEEYGINSSRLNKVTAISLNSRIEIISKIDIIRYAYLWVNIIKLD